MHVFEACFGFCFGASPIEVRQLDAPPVTRASSLVGDKCGAKLSEEDTEILQDVIPLPPSFLSVAHGTAVELRQVENEENGVEQKMTVTVMDAPYIGPAPQPASLCSLRPEVRPELASLLISATSLSKISFHSPSLQLSTLESTASLGSGTIALISDVRVSIGGERQASDCGPIAVKLSTLEQLLASVTEPLWVGQGAQGAVLKAQWRSGDCTVAVKWLVSDGGDLPAAYMEALLAKILAHPFLVQTFEYGMCKLDGSFDQLLQQYQQQQQPRQEEKQQRQHEVQQPPETSPQAVNQPLYQYALDSLGKPLCHGGQEEPAQEQQQVQQQQQQQNPREGQSEAGGGDSSPAPFPYLPSHIVLNPVQHPARSASAAGAIAPSACCGIRGECFSCAVCCSGSNTHGSVPGAEYPTTQSRETARAPTAEELSVSPHGLGTQRTWVGAAPSPFEVLTACRDSFDGSGTPIGLRPVDCVGVLKQLGAVRGKYVVQIVSEWCDEGTLHAAIRRGVFKAYPPGPGVPGRSRTWALRALLRTAREVAMGMCHLHSLGIIHGDLKPGNVLLKSSRVDSRGFVAKVADFGLSRLCNHREEFVTTANWGTVPYMAGEYLDNRLYKSSDVYSFGVLLWQMYTGKAPFAEHLEAQVAVGVMMGNLQLEWPTNMPPPLLQLGQACCRHEPDQRPTFKEVVVALMGVEAQAREAHARAKMGIRRIDGSLSLVSRHVHGSNGGLTLPLAHAMSHPQPHGAAAGATLTGSPARHPLYPSQSLHHSHHHHQIQPNHFHYQLQNQPVATQLQHHLLLQQQQQKQCVSHPVVTCGSSNTVPNCDSGPGVPPSPFVSNVGADVVGVVSMTAPAAIPSQQTKQVLPQALAAAPQPPFPLPQPYQQPQPQPALITQTSQLPPNFPSGRFMPTSTSRLHIRTSFADIPQAASPAEGECADYGFDVSSVAQGTNSPPPTLSDSLPVHTAVAPPKLPAATGVVTMSSFTCSSVTESPPVPFALSPMSPAGGLAWAACFSPTAVPGNERNGSVLVSPTFSLAAKIPPIHARSLGPTIVARDAAPLEAVRKSVDFPVDGTKMPVVEFTSVFGEALDSLGSSALLGSTTRLPPAGSALAAVLETCPPQQLAQQQQQQQQQQQPPAPGAPLALVQPMACGLPCRPPQTSYLPGAICGCASTESSEPCARATVHGISVAAAAAPQLQLLPDVQQHASLPVPLPNADGNGVHQGTPTSLSASMAVPAGNCYSANLPRLEEHRPQVVHQPRAQQGGQSAYSASFTPPAYAVGAAAAGNGDSGGVWAGWMTSSCISSAGLHGLVQQQQQQPQQQQQQQQPQSAGIARGALRGGRVVASTLCGVSGASLPAALAVPHRRPRCAFGLASGTGAAASRRGSGAGPMPHLHGFNTGFPAAGPLLDDLPSPGFASMMLIPLAPLHESVEGPGTGAEA